MIATHRRHSILLPHKKIQKQQGTSMHLTILFVSLLTALSVRADQNCEHVYCNAAMQIQKNTIEDFITKSLRERPRLRRGGRCLESTFTLKDFQRIGSTGLSEMRIIDTSLNTTASFPRTEMHGWKLLTPTTTSSNGGLFLSSYIPTTYKPRKGTIEIEAHFIIPQTDAPNEGVEKYVKIGFWVDCTQEGQPIGEDGLTFVTSKDVLIPNKSSFNGAKAIRISATIRVKPHAQPKDLFRILLNRVSVAEDKTEFDHKQGIALNSVTIRYPI